METEERTLYLLEEKQVFSKSLIWDIQQRYFAERGVDAWRHGEVPHYVTSNPTMAESYAAIVFAFRNDQLRLHPGKIDEPFYLCELGAGSGRFAFHFLSRLKRLCEQEDVPLTDFRYVITDVAESNLAFWNDHPRFRPFFESGMLDMALFDVNASNALQLRRSETTINAGNLAHPLIVIGNYVFDTVPQEQYYFGQQKCYECLVTLASDQDPQPESAAELMYSIHYKYDYRELTEIPFEENFLRAILDSYRNSVDRAHLFFPATSLRCLQRLRALSTQGLLLLSSDKGDHQLPGNLSSSPLGLVYHGSFSVTVNYHAFCVYAEQHNGIALFPDRSYNSVNTGCILLLPDAAAYTETRNTYQRQVRDFGPDDFYKLSHQLSQHPEILTAGGILSYLRLGHYDSQLFLACMTQLGALIPELDEKERQELKAIFATTWETYFPLGEAQDIPWCIACLCYEMNDFELALEYYEKSLDIYGPFSGTLCNMAVCYSLLGNDETAESLLLQVLQTEPEYEPAKDILEEVRRGLKRPAAFAAPND